LTVGVLSIIIIPLAASFFMAIAYLATRFLMSTESSVAIIFYYSLALLITSLIYISFEVNRNN